MASGLWLSAGCGALTDELKHVAGDDGTADAGGVAPTDASADAGVASTDASGVRVGVDMGAPVRVLVAAPLDVVAIGADDTGTYWTNARGELWALPAAGGRPRRLATDRDTGVICRAETSPVPVGASVFWVSGTGSVLHRTRKDGTADEPLVRGLLDPGNLAADATHLYWSEAQGTPGQGLWMIRTLPPDAPPGATPTIVMLRSLDEQVSSIAVAGGWLYWTEYPAESTMYYGTLWLAPTAGTPGATGGPYYGDLRPYGLATIGDAVALAYYEKNIWTSTLAVLQPSQGYLKPVVVLPESNYVAGLTAFDGWLLATAGESPGCGATPNWKVYATPIAGGPLTVIADGLQVPATMGPAGATYVDRAGQLVAISRADLQALFQRLAAIPTAGPAI